MAKEPDRFSKAEAGMKQKPASSAERSFSSTKRSISSSVNGSL